MSIYSVPFWQSEYPEFEENKELFLNSIKEYESKNESIIKSNVFGYRSPETLHNLEELYPLFEYICQMGFKACSDLDFIDCDIALTSAWLNINNSRQCMITDHVHENVFSGVFYLSSPEGSGKFILPNPAINRMWDGCKLSLNKNEYTAEKISIDPIEGSILLYPSYLPHSTETNDHDEERISISFNLIALPKGSINR